MSLVSSLYTGQTGLESSSTDLSVIGDNIANSNTVGFKSARADFSDAMSQQMLGSGGVTSQVGLGSQLENVQKIMTQGALNNTGVATDLALDGSGFFAVKGSHNGQLGQYYTRAGQFNLDKNGFFVNQEGLRVQGYTADPTGLVLSSSGDLKLGDTSSSPLATANIIAKANLDASSAVMAFDPTTPGTTSNFNTSVTAFDSLGVQHQIDIYFARDAGGPPATWDYHAMTDSTGVTGGVPGTLTEVATGTLTFDLTGKLASVAPVPTAFNPINATQAQTLTFNFGDIASGGTGLQFTSFAAPSAAVQVTQDGYGPGVLSNISIDKVGIIEGAFSNGQSRVVGQLAIASVPSGDRMDRAGGNLFSQTTGSGDITLGKAGSNGRGGVVAGALENSNVDLSSEFIKMIAAQRNYQASAKTVQTADALLNELMNLKR